MKVMNIPGMWLAAFALTAIAFATPQLRAKTPLIWPDGIPNAPAAVYQNVDGNGLGVLLHDAASQARTWSRATLTEKQILSELFVAIETDLTDGPSKTNSAVILAKADALQLQVCRVVKSTEAAYLMFWVKPGVKDYNGCFWGIRENGSYCSRICILAPHDFSDGYWSSSKISFDETHAFAFMSTGHMQDYMGSNDSDWCHKSYDLGFDVFLHLNQINVNGLADNLPVFLMWHGQADRKDFLEKGRKMQVETAFDTVATELTGLPHKYLGVYFIEQVYIKGDRWEVTELPAVRLHGNSDLLKNIVNGLEAILPDGKPQWPQIWEPGNL